MNDILPPIPNVRTHSCQSGVHWKCTNKRWMFTLESLVRCDCDCHKYTGQLDIEI